MVELQVQEVILWVVLQTKWRLRSAKDFQAAAKNLSHSNYVQAGRPLKILENVDQKTMNQPRALLSKTACKRFPFLLLLVSKLGCVGVVGRFFTVINMALFSLRRLKSLLLCHQTEISCA